MAMQLTKESGLRRDQRWMVLELFSTKMGLSMKASLDITKSMDLGERSIQMENSILESIKKGKLKEKVRFRISKVENMKENGKMTNRRAKELKYGKMEMQFIKVNLEKERNMEEESSHGLKDPIMMEISIMGSLKEEENITSEIKKKPTMEPSIKEL